MVSPTSITQVTDLQLEVFTKFRSAALRSIFLNLVFNLFWIEQIKFEIRDA